MTQGRKVPPEEVAIFREWYLQTGNASLAARKIKAHVQTGAKLAREANADEEFCKKRKQRLAHALEEVESMLLDASKTVSRRIKTKPPTLADLRDMKGYHDPRPQYFTGLVNAHRTLAAKAAKAEERDKPPQVIVNVHTKDDELEVSGADRPEPKQTTE